MLDIPRAMTTVAVAEGAQAVSLTDARRVLNFSIGGYPAVSADMHRVAQLWDGGGNRPVKYFNFDPRRADQLVFSPPSPGGTALIEYVQTLTRPADAAFDASEPWGGLLAPYHTLIAYRAGMELFQADEREDETAHLMAQFQARLSEASAFLGNTSVPSLIIPPENRDDGGARG